MKNNTVITIIALVVVAGGAFFGGMQYQKSQTPSTASGQLAQGGQGGANGQGGRFGGRRGGGFGGATVGQVVSEDANSLTVKLADGSSKIINISGSTTFSKAASASLSDIKTGDRVAAFGATNSDGTVTAQNVQINPMMRNGQGGGPRPTQ